MSLEEFTFEIKEPYKEFNDHLEIPFNDRIILSASFGAGKTYFLKEFFKNHEKYEAIHLYPVNYSVASNEDIFELIKFDILFELLKREIVFEKEDFNKIDYLPIFFQENTNKIVDVFRPLISSIPVIGKSLYDISGNLKNLLEEFEKKHHNIQIDDRKSIVDYLEKLTQKTGSIKEEDFYTQLICQLVNQLKDIKEDKEKSKKKTVLIIDDLDRIDPEHIFRILNVLAAQIDRSGSDNKFDFDKIILVFDQQNVRNIFKNRYGTNVDYTGYIDKFYSYKIFEFTNVEGLKKEIKRLLNTIKINEQSVALALDRDIIFDATFIFQNLIEANAITPRRLLKVLNSPFSLNSKLIRFENSKDAYKADQFPIITVVKLLLHVFESFDDLLEAVEELKSRTDYIDGNQIEEVKSIIENCLVILNVNTHKFEVNESFSYAPSFNTSLKIQYKLLYFPKERKYGLKVESDSIKNIKIGESFMILHDTLTKIKKNHLI